MADADAAVRLSAAAALRALVDDFGFEVAPFMGCVGGVMQGLAAMLVESDELDTQTQVDGCVGRWVGGCERHDGNRKETSFLGGGGWRRVCCGWC